MPTFKYGDVSALTLDERITTPSIHIRKNSNHWYVPLFEGDKGSVIKSGDYNYTLGGFKVGNLRVAISREREQENEYLFLIADNFYTFEDGVLSLADSPTIIESNISEIGKFGLKDAFKDCTGLNGSISFPNLTSIGDYGLDSAFFKCVGLTSISFPKLANIGNYGLNTAFYGCTGLTSISFPKLTNIGNYGLLYAFSYCTELKEIHFNSFLSGHPQCSANYLGCRDATVYFDL